jgi:Site-specific recombinase XerC
VERHGPTKTAAERKLKEALRDRVFMPGSEDITPETRVSVVAELWWKEFQNEGKSPGTLRAYRDRLDRQILPALGNLRLQELSPGAVSRFLVTVTEKHGPGVTKLCRAVLNGVTTYALKRDALDRSPVRDVGRITTTKPKKPARALSLAEVRQIRALISYDLVSIRRDLPDFVNMMIATGLRIGETAAIVWDAVDLVAGTVEVRGTVIRVKGQGLIIKPEPKSENGYRKLELPSWMISIVETRKKKSSGRVDAPVFPAPKGGLRDPDNTQKHLDAMFEFVGEPDLTSHVFRKTVVTLMDESGLSARMAADQLGHANPSFTLDNYMGRKTRATGAKAVMEAVA